MRFNVEFLPDVTLLKRPAATRNRRPRAPKKRAKSSTMSSNIARWQVPQGAYLTLQFIPTELIREILDHTTEGRIGQCFLTKDDVYNEDEEKNFNDAMKALLNLCLVSKRLRDVTQPRLVECSGQILFLKTRHAATRYASESRPILLLVRTLIYRPDLRDFLCGVDLIGRWDRTEEDDTNLRTLHHVFFRDVSWEDGLAPDIREFQETTGVNFSSLVKSIPAKVLQKWVMKSNDLPFWDMFQKADIDLLLHTIQEPEHNPGAMTVLPKVLADAFYQCSPGPSLLLLLLSKSIKSLVIHLEEDKIEHKEIILQHKLNRGAFVNLESAALDIYGGSSPSKKCNLLPPERFFLCLPQLRWLRINRTGDNIREDESTFSKLEDLHGISNVNVLYLDAVNGLQPRYINALLRSFKRLRSFSFRHTPSALDTSSISTTAVSDREHTKGIMTGLQAHVHSLETLRIRCTRNCDRCSGVIRISEFNELLDLEVYHKSLEFGERGARHIAASLPKSLQNLTIQYELSNSDITWMDPRWIPVSLNRALHDFGAAIGGEFRSNIPWPELRCVTLRRNEMALYGPLHSAGPIEAKFKRWFKISELHGERELREVFAKSKCAFRVCWDNYDFGSEKNE